MIRMLIGMGCILFSLLCQAGEKPPEKSIDSPNVILITLDGVRWQEVFQGTDPLLQSKGPSVPLFKNLKKHFQTSGILGGNLSAGEELKVSNERNISLPAYQSLMAGTPPPRCLSNFCSQIPVETFPERIARELNLKPTEVVIFGSWSKISRAVEHESGKILVNTGISEFQDGTHDAELLELNRQQEKDTPSWSQARYDRYTFSQAKRYLEKHKPRFLYIAFGDSDEWAHEGNYPSYVQSLVQYDEWIEDLIVTLSKMGNYGRSTHLIVTTDHGRGNGSKWTQHGPSIPESKYIWLFSKGPHSLPKTSLSHYSHLDIRPTIEALMHLKPTECIRCGRVIPEIVYTPPENPKKNRNLQKVSDRKKKSVQKK